MREFPGGVMREGEMRRKVGRKVLRRKDGVGRGVQGGYGAVARLHPIYDVLRRFRFLKVGDHWVHPRHPLHRHVEMTADGQPQAQDEERQQDLVQPQLDHVR